MSVLFDGSAFCRTARSPREVEANVASRTEAEGLSDVFGNRDRPLRAPGADLGRHCAYQCVTQYRLRHPTPNLGSPIRHVPPTPIKGPASFERP